MKTSTEKQIEELSDMLKNHITAENRDMADLLSEFREFREEVKPMLELYNNSRGFYTIIVGTLKILAMLGAGIAALLYIKHILLK